MAAKTQSGLWEEILKEVRKARNADVRIGVISSGGGPSEPGQISITELAMIHEFGAPNAGIPERSFIRATFSDYAKAEFETNIKKLAKAIVSGKMKTERALNILGAWSAAAVKRSISERLIKQDLKPATIKRKNRTAKDKSDATTALVDTGRLINAIAYEVVMGGDE